MKNVQSRPDPRSRNHLDDRCRERDLDADAGGECSPGAPSRTAGTRPLPIGAVARAEQRIQEFECERLRRRTAAIERAEQVLADAQVAKRRLFGEEGSARWLRHRDEQRSRRPGAVPPLDATVEELRRSRQRAAVHAASARLLAELGVGTASVVQAARDTGDRLHQVLEAGAWMPREGLTLREIPPELMPLHDEAEIQVVVHEPPYSGTRSSASFSNGGGFVRETSPVADRFTGQVGQSVRLSIVDAPDGSLAVVDDTRLLRQGFLMPRAGRITVFVDLTVQRSTHQVAYEDEWGTSVADLEQTSLITMHSVGSDGDDVEAQGIQMSRYRKTVNTTGQVILQGLPEGSRFSVAMLTDRSYAQDEVVLLDVGAHAFHQVYVDDMAVRSTMNFRYAIDRLRISVLP